MKIKISISALFLISITILYFFGFCKWDLSLYLLGVFAVIIYMMIFIIQQKNHDHLLQQKQRFESTLENNKNIKSKILK